MAKQLRLKPNGPSCSLVMVRSQYVKSGYPIGEICKVSGGYTYSHAPFPQTNRGPVKNKKQAILKVVRGHQSWVGLLPGQLKS